MQKRRCRAMVAHRRHAHKHTEIHTNIYIYMSVWKGFNLIIPVCWNLFVLKFQFYVMRFYEKERVQFVLFRAILFSHCTWEGTNTLVQSCRKWTEIDNFRRYFMYLWRCYTFWYGTQHSLSSATIKKNSRNEEKKHVTQNTKCME